MNVALVVALAAVLVAVRVWRRRRRATPEAAPHRIGRWTVTGDVGLVASREIRERVRGRAFRIGTLLILAVVAGAIIIPTLTKSVPRPQEVGVVGSLTAPQRASIEASAKSVATTVRFVPQSDLAAADSSLRAGHIDVAVADGRELVVYEPVASSDTSTTAQFVRAMSGDLGVAEAFAAARLSPEQAKALAGAKPLPVTSVRPGKSTGGASATSVIGLILIFIMLTQYNTWILMGVMEEKSSRVIEVLLAALRPIQLLAGKVLGIGLVAFGQAALVVVVALVLAEAVGSDILHGTEPAVLAATLVWLVLGYAFYCWVYAAGGSLVERQDQVQSLALPLSLPIIFGYVFSLITASTGSASPFFTVLAYLPPTAPFAMPVLVSFRTVTWWEFAASAAISIVCTVVVARLAAGIYRRAILRTGGRVRLRDVLPMAERTRPA
ncbi:MAG: ABC transporter permease [Acidimicrobiales bacterium]|jgi:ABC-2 type transport system permease protein